MVSKSWSTYGIYKKIHNHIQPEIPSRSLSFLLFSQEYRGISTNKSGLT